MTAKQATPQVVVLLLVLGASCVAVRTSFRHTTPLPPGDSVWRVSYEAHFHAQKAGAALRAAFPENTAYCRVTAHNVAPSELTIEQHRPSRVRKDIVARAPKAGDYTFKADFEVRLSTRGGGRPDHRKVTLTAEEKAKYLKDEKTTIDVSHPLVLETLDKLRGEPGGKAELTQRLFQYCVDSIAAGRESDPHDAVGTLRKGAGSPLGRARAMVALCRAAKIPARLVTGLEIKKGSNVRPHTWVEVLADSRWEPFDIEYEFSRELPHHYAPVRRDGAQIVRVDKDSTNFVPKFSVVDIPPPAGSFDLDSGNALNILDLMRLPAQLHEVLALIMLLPLGALVTAIFRTIVGIRTFGTFTPTLLALSFIYNDWRMGLIVLIAALILGLASRTLLDRLKLLMVPRLGIMLTLVVLCVVFSISVFHYFALTVSGQTVLLPMVILTMLIERFYVTTEEDSFLFAIKLLAGTLVLGFIVYLLLCWKTVGQMLLVYPELHCFTVAALILVGRYTGYRLTELWRFRDMAGKQP